MKKFCIFFSILILNCNFCLSKFDTNFCVAESETVTYAKALSNCTLYRSSTLEETLDNIIFIVPETYFVVLLGVVSESCYKVQYGNYIGYISSQDVEIATFSPIVKFLTGITCDIKETSGTQIWSKPSASDGTVLTTIPAGTTYIEYIASVYGTIPSGGESNLWYYVVYTPASYSTNVYEGYIYSENVTNLSEIIANTEINPDEIVSSDEISNTAIEISSSVKSLIIAIISIPIVLLVAIILFKFVKKLQENTISRKNLKNENDRENSNMLLKNENYNYDSNESSYLVHGKLKEQIENLSGTTFVRKRNKNSFQNRTKTKNSIYPKFPSYDSDDDLL